MALIPALRWRIGCKIECISVHQDLRLHGDGVTDSLHHVTTVFGIANQSGQALRRFVRLDFQTGFKTLTSALNALAQHRSLGVKMSGDVDAGFFDVDFHHVAVPADLRQQSKAQGHTKVR